MTRTTFPAGGPNLAAIGLALAFAAAVGAHVGPQPSVHDTVAGILERLKRELPAAKLKALTGPQAEALLTSTERQVLGAEHLSFVVNVPVTVSIIREATGTEDLFWLKARGFEKTGASMQVGSTACAVWERGFSAGRVGLGVNSLKGGGLHYFVAVRPQQAGDRPRLTEFYPGALRTAVVEDGAKPYIDRDETLAAVPPALRGQVLVRTAHAWRDDARLIDRLRFTAFPSGARPDHIVLTWSADPRTTQAVQWRTDPTARQGVVEYRRASEAETAVRRAQATTRRVESPELVNDSVISWHTATLSGLQPGTTYLYRVGDGTPTGWSDPAEFTTAPARAVPFSFIYMGDAQNGLDRWGLLVTNAFQARPDAAFYLMAGDLVNRGAERDDWDSLFHHAQGIYNRRQLVPVIGNHECQGGQPRLYLQFFDLPRNGPPNLEPERAYWFEYSNALFVVLDSNLPPQSQVSWLERTLARSRATWKFVSYHHPAYSSAPKRDNREIRKLWTRVFDKYHVDLALQGHDHAYLRTYPMKEGRPVASPQEGTVYLVSVSGTKMYAQDPRNYTAFGMTNVATYQALDIRIDGNRLLYRAYDLEGRLRDEFVIQK